jgi:hypothetical protein
MVPSAHPDTLCDSSLKLSTTSSFQIVPKSAFKIEEFKLLGYNATREQGFADYLLSSWFLATLILLPRRWRQHFSLKLRLTFNGLHGHIDLSQKTELFITAVVRTSNLVQHSNCPPVVCYIMYTVY